MVSLMVVVIVVVLLTAAVLLLYGCSNSNSDSRCVNIISIWCPLVVFYGCYKDF